MSEERASCDETSGCGWIARQDPVIVVRRSCGCTVRRGHDGRVVMGVWDMLVVVERGE